MAGNRGQNRLLWRVTRKLFLLAWLFGAVALWLLQHEWPVILLGSASLALLVSLTTALFFWVDVLLPLLQLRQTLQRGASRDYLYRPLPAEDDEIGQLAQEVNRALHTITELVSEQNHARRELVNTREKLRQQQAIEELNSRLTKRIQELSLLFQVVQEINVTIDLDELLGRLVRLVGETLGYRSFSIILRDPHTGKDELSACFGVDLADPPWYIALFLQGWYDQQLEAQEGRPILIPDTRYSSRLLRENQADAPVALLAVPLLSRHKERLGLFLLSRPVEEAFTIGDIRLFLIVSHQAGMAVRNARLHQKTRELALTDELTEISNRRHLRRRLDLEWERTQRFASPLSVLMIDIDHFKEYNDSHGHLQGDVALSRIARFLHSQTRRTDTLARYGGEEFALVLSNTNKEQAAAVAEKLLAGVRELEIPTAEGERHQLTISIGVATYPEDARNIKGLIGAADRALYEAKKEGRDRVLLYEGPPLELQNIHTNHSPSPIESPPPRSVPGVGPGEVL